MFLWGLAGNLWAQNTPPQPPPPVQKRFPRPYQPQVKEVNETDSELLLSLMKGRPELFEEYLQKKDEYKIQLIWTQIRRDERNRPIVKHHSFHLDSTQYFFPASTIKLAASALALEKINQMRVPGFTKDSRIEFSAGFNSSPAEKRDPNVRDKRPTIANYIKQILLVSDNNAYDRLYEFLGQQYFNEKLWEKGYTSSRMIQRYQWFVNKEYNRYTNAWKVYNDDDSLLYTQLPLYNPVDITFKAKNTLVGRGLMNNGKLIPAPKDFSTYNFISLRHLHEITMAICLPSTVPAWRRFRLTKDDYAFLHRYMSMYPNECRDPHYDADFWYAGRWKFFLFGGVEQEPPPNIRIFNKVGLSNNFLLDTAYIVDFETGTEFLLTGIIFCDDNGIINDNFEDYQRIGMPFFGNIGRVIYEYERSQPRRFTPNLDFYKHNYREEPKP
jgi:hypothetical protein